jgi:thiamine-phosphate pyrophosphorylase
VAIGGISLNNMEDVLKAGADGIAVISAVACAPDMEQAVRELLKRFKEFKCSKNRKE